MRFVTYGSDYGWRTGVQVGEIVVDSTNAAEQAGLSSSGDYRWTSTRRILGTGPSALKALHTAAVGLADDGTSPWVRPLHKVRLGPPIVDPAKIICLGLNYRDHAQETSSEIPSAPVLFAKFANSLVGPRADIVIPRVSEQIDYEGELAVVIGRITKDVSPGLALDNVAGVMAFNDVSARDLQHQTSQWLAGKAIDTFAPCGPALVTLDEIAGGVQKLQLQTRYNGIVVQDDSTSSMIFGVAETIAFISELITLEPGDIVATGTPAGVGFRRTPQVRLGPGDIIEVEIESIGTLRNSVVSQHDAPSVSRTLSRV